MYLKGAGGGLAQVALGGGGGGRPTLLVLWSPASEKRGIGYRWYARTTSMIRVEDPGTSFMLYLGPGPPSLLHLTRASETEPYAGDTIMTSQCHPFVSYPGKRNICSLSSLY
jgi:hypothetical protein